MRYWDAAALVPLVVDEPASSLAREWLAEDERIITWPAFLTGFRREESETPSRATARSSRRARSGAFLAPDQAQGRISVCLPGTLPTGARNAP